MRLRLIYLRAQIASTLSRRFRCWVSRVLTEETVEGAASSLNTNLWHDRQSERSWT